MFLTLLGVLDVLPSPFSFSWILAFVVLLVRFSVGRIMHNKLMEILFADCDPEKMYEVLTLLISNDKSRKIDHTLLLERANTILYLPDRLEEGLMNLQGVSFSPKDVNRECLRIYLMSCYGYALKDREMFDSARNELLKYPLTAGKNVYGNRLYQNLCKSLAFKDAMWNGEYEEARRKIELDFFEPTHLLGRVNTYMDLARLDLEFKEYYSAKQHLTFVVTHGQKIPFVKEAEEMLLSVNEMIENSKGEK